MQRKLSQGKGGMLAILGLSSNEFEKILRENEELECYIANDNTINKLLIVEKLNH